MGGAAQVDVRAHGLAMQAKVGAMLVHPRQTAWKQLMTAILKHAMPDTGVPGPAPRHWFTCADRFEGRPPITPARWIPSGLSTGGA